MPGPPRKSGVVVPQRLPWRRRLMASAVALLYWLCIKSWRGVWKDKADIPQAQAPVIFCIWHSNFALAFASYDDHAIKKWKENGLVAWVSASGDGSFLTSVLNKFGVETVRGSTSRRGPQSLLEASRWLRKGYSVAMTPDGPRGPAKQIQDGVLNLAQVSGRPIIPISNFAHWKICLRNWDRSQIPLPFSKCEFYDNHPIYVPRHATAEEREAIRAKLAEAMKEITKDQ